MERTGFRVMPRNWRHLSRVELRLWSCVDTYDSNRLRDEDNEIADKLASCPSLVENEV